MGYSLTCPVLCEQGVKLSHQSCLCCLMQVQPGSVAEQSGLQAGDGVLQINGAATETLEHEAAKMEIIRAGNEVQFLIQR